MARKAVETVSTGCKPLRSSKAFNRRKQVDDRKGKKTQETGQKDSGKHVDVDELPGELHEIQRVDYATISALVSVDKIGPNPTMRSAGRDESPNSISSPAALYAANGHRIRLDREKVLPSSSDLKLARLLSNAHRAPLANRKLFGTSWPAHNGYDLKGAVTLGSPYIRRPAKGLPTGRPSFDMQTDPAKRKQMHEGVSEGHSSTARSAAPGAAFRSKPYIWNLYGFAYRRSGDPCHPCLESENETVRHPSGSMFSIEVFMREWKKMSKDSNGRFQLLRRVAPCDLPRVFRDEIPPSVLGEILETLWDWQLTQVRCSSPEVGPLGQTPPRRVVKTPVSHTKQEPEQAPSKSGEEFLYELSENPKTGSLEEFTSWNKHRVDAEENRGSLGTASDTDMSHATSMSPGKKINTRTVVPTKSDFAQLVRTPRGLNQVHSASPTWFRRILKEKESQIGTGKTGSVTRAMSDWSKDTVGPMNGKQRVHKICTQQLIIQPCENLRKFDEVLSRCGILNPFLHDNRRRESTVIATASVNPDPTCSSRTDFTLVEALSGSFSTQVRNFKFDELELLDGAASPATDEQPGSQSSTRHTCARGVSFQIEDYLRNADADQHSHATAPAHIEWLFDVLKSITKCGRFSLALKMMGEKARFIVATLLDHFAAGILIEQEDLRSCDSGGVISKNQVGLFDAGPGHTYVAITPEHGPHSGGGTFQSNTAGVLLNPASGQCSKRLVQVEQLRELRTLYRIDMQ